MMSKERRDLQGLYTPSCGNSGSVRENSGSLTVRDYFVLEFFIRSWEH